MVNHVAGTSASYDHTRVQNTDHSPGVLGAVERVKAGLGSAGLAARLRRPRFLRGPYLDRAVDAQSITTDRLVLRPHRVADAERWYVLQSNPDVVRYMSWGIRDRAQSREHLAARSHHTKLWQTDDFLALAIEHDGVLIGDVSLQLRSVDRDVRSVEMGWVLDPEYQGSGYAAEAARAALDVAFTQVGARFVTVVIDRRNERSVGLAQRLGFRTLSSDSSSHLMTMVPEDLTGSRRDEN